METIETVQKVCLGDLLTVVLAKSGRVYTLGDNILGQLGISNQITQLTTPQKVNIEREIAEVSCGSNHVICYTKDCKQVYAWGSNKKKQILPNSSTKRFDAPIKIGHLKQALANKIICGPRTTFCVSRLTPDFPKETNFKPDELKALNNQLMLMKRENEGLTKKNTIAVNEIETLRNEIKQLKQALQNAERVQSKRGFLSNASTQTHINPEENEGVFDGKQTFNVE
jgi:regulator of replication initiation timing